MIRTRKTWLLATLAIICLAFAFTNLLQLRTARASDTLTTYTDEQLEEYVEVQNADFGLPESFGAIAGDSIYKKLDNTLSTPSFVYKFYFTPNKGRHTALGLRKNWSGYQVIFDGTRVICKFGGEIVVDGVFTGEKHLVEVGVIDIKNADETWFFLKVDGAYKVSVTAAITDAACCEKGISIWGEQTAKFEQVDVIEYEDYITVQNDDIGAASSITNTNSSFGEYKMNTTQATSSVKYKFVYEKGTGALYIVMRGEKDSWGASGYTFILNGSTLQYPTDGTMYNAFSTESNLYTVEISVIDIKNSTNVYIGVSIDGVMKVEAKVAQKTVGEYINMFGVDGSTSKFKQYSYDVTFTDVETREVLVGQQIGALPAAPSEVENFCGWADQDSNAVTAEMVPNGDVVATAKSHIIEVIAGTPATCNENGKTNGEKCKLCQTVITAQEELTKLGHDLVEVPEVPASCSQTGTTAGEKCSRCEHVESGLEPIPLAEHTVVTDEAVASTCLSRGKSQGSHCTECNKTIVEQEILPLGDHNYVDGKCTVCEEADPDYVPADDTGCSGDIGGEAYGFLLVGAILLMINIRKKSINTKTNR